MCKTLRVIFTFALFLWAVPALALELGSDQLTFRYQQINEPYGVIPCTQEKLPVGLFEWKVTCQNEREKHEYFVHLVVQFYPQTIHGKNAYEVLYWVTDLTTMPTKHDSSTIWIHNNESTSFIKVLELSQGIEDDNAYLRLAVRL